LIKKLDKLILKAFIGPFIATFFVTLFVLVMQFFWKYIDDLVGKGLELSAILELTGYVPATAIPLALPLAILLSSIMTFGNLGESFELVAIRSAGIPLLRFMKPLIVVSLGVSLIAFIVSNWVIPVAQLKFTTMLYDIRVAKPAFDLKAGIFYTKLPGYAIKIGHKADDGSTIEDVIIYENVSSLQDNIIVAEKGEMKMSEDKKFLQFDLENGWRYQERGGYATVETEFYRMGFKHYRKVFDLSSFEVLKTPDSGWKASSPAPKVDPAIKRYEDYLPDSTYSLAWQRAVDRMNLIKSSLDVIAPENDLRRREMRYTLIEFHKKFSLSLACFVLFMIGAPLGSIIRKGGLGMPLVIAVVFFLVFHVTNMFGEKLSKQDAMTPMGGMWMSTLLLMPIGIWLTWKAMNDAQLFSNEFYHRGFRRLAAMLPKRRTKPAA